MTKKWSFRFVADQIGTVAVLVPHRNPSKISIISFGCCYASFQSILIILNVSESLESPLLFFFGTVLVLLTQEAVAERKCDPGIQTRHLCDCASW